MSIISFPEEGHNTNTTNISNTITGTTNTTATTNTTYCTMAIWDAHARMVWVMVPCDQRRTTHILICQHTEVEPGDDQHLSEPARSVVVYVNGDQEEYQWTLESCLGHHRRYYDTKISLLYNCLTRSFHGTSKLNEEFHTYLKLTLSTFIERDICLRDSDIVPMCVNVLQLLSQNLSKTVNSSVTVERGIAQPGDYTCRKTQTGIAGCCYSLVVAPERLSTYDPNTCNSKVNAIQTLFNIDALHQSLLVHDMLPMADVVTCGSHQFKCGNQECVSDKVIIDGSGDCLDGYDEDSTFGMCHITKRDAFIYGNRAECGNCHRDNCTCGRHFYHCQEAGCVPWHKLCDSVTNCPHGDDEEKCGNLLSAKTSRESQMLSREPNYFQLFQCPRSGYFIDQDKLGDGEIDCPVSITVVETLRFYDRVESTMFLAEDERSPMRNITATSCPSNTLWCPYSINHECFPFQRICVFDRDNLGRMQFCPNGGHLLHCSMIECLGFYKCPMSYCLPLSRVCDGVRDCPRGDEERNCPSLPMLCPGMFRCKGSGGCVHQSHVCDGIRDCPVYGDDEWSCDTAECPPGCHCQAASMYCYMAELSSIDCKQYRSISLHMLNYKYNQSVLTLNNVSSAISFTLKHTNLSEIPTFIPETSSNRLLYIMMVHSKFKVINIHNFAGMIMLNYLNVSYNGIHTIHPESFADLESLEILDMSYNKLMTLNFNILSFMVKLHTFYVKSNLLKQITVNMYLISELRVLDISENLIGFVKSTSKSSKTI